jgi:hypothetical protein
MKCSHCNRVMTPCLTGVCAWCWHQAIMAAWKMKGERHDKQLPSPDNPSAHYNPQPREHKRKPDR